MSSTVGVARESPIVFATMKEFPTTLIVAPYWNDPHHVGVNRVERFIRWSNRNGRKIIVISAGTEDKVQEREWGREIIIKDPLKMPVKYGGEALYTRKFNLFRRAWKAFSYLMFVPDQTVIWAKKIAKHPFVARYIEDVDVVLSSSPPESVHVSSSLIARKFGLPLIVDMRDGWLDDPLRPIVEKSRVRHYLERRLERKIMAVANHIFVTSSAWKRKLLIRYPDAKEKVTVLTNGYPLPGTEVAKNEKKNSDSLSLTLIHAGQFSASRGSQKIGYLLQPILNGTEALQLPPESTIILLGNLEQSEMVEFETWRGKLGGRGWKLIHVPQVPRNEVPQKLREADGLLLLCASNAAIPSKLYEYIQTSKPILAITPNTSAVWQLCEEIPQVFLFDCFVEGKKDFSVIREFLAACRTGNHPFTIPKEFTDEHLSTIFNKVVDGVRRYDSSASLKSL